MGLINFISKLINLTVNRQVVKVLACSTCSNYVQNALDICRRYGFAPTTAEFLNVCSRSKISIHIGIDRCLKLCQFGKYKFYLEITTCACEAYE